MSSLYLAFVVRYSVNGLLLDDWGFVHLVHAAIHGHLTFAALWTQHNENRMLVPNAIMVALAVATHDNTRAAMIISALLFVGSYFLFLLALGSYLGRRLTVAPVVATGVLWFSLTDWQNALWGFQFAWYLIMFLFMAMLCLFLVKPVERRGAMVVGAALAVATIASYSSAQGEFLWPIGLLCLLWPVQGGPKAWTRQTQVFVTLWVATATVVTVIYFRGFTQSGPGNIVNVLRHRPLEMLQSVLANIGEVIPTGAPDVPFHVAIGVVLLVCAGVVVVRSVRQRKVGSANPLPVCLIMFALLFDPPIPSIRLLFGVVSTLASRYTMANLLVPIAIVAYVLLRAGLYADEQRLGTAWSHMDALMKLAFGSVACFLLIQFIVSTSDGIGHGRSSERSMTIGSRLVVNRHLILRNRTCYAFAIEEYAGEVGDPQALEQAEIDRLSPFSEGQYQKYRTEGLPSLCR